MQRILFIILLFTGYIYSQQVQPLVADTNSSGAYDVNHIKILGTKNDAAHHRMPVDMTGALTGTVSVSNFPDSSKSRLKQNVVVTNFPDSSKSRLKQNVVVTNFPANPSTSIRQDSLLALIKLIYGREYSLLINQTNGNQLFTPYLSYIRSSYTFKAASDTATYNFNNNYLKCYVTVYDSSATADTLIFESYSYAKLGYTAQMIGFKDVATDLIEADNTTVVVSGTNAKEWVINRFRPGLVRVRPKSLAGRSAFKTKRVVFVGVN
jgi:hypothetical protein